MCPLLKFASPWGSCRCFARGTIPVFCPFLETLTSLPLPWPSLPTFQALNVAYARHDAVADYTTACLAFLEAGGRADLQDLLRQHTVSKLSALTVQRQYPPGSAPPRSMRVADAGSGAAGGSSTDAGGGNDGVAPQALASVVGVLQQILQMHEG